MNLFAKKEEETDEDELELLEEKRLTRKKFKDLNPQNKKARKEPPKPWGKKERLFVLILLLSTVLIAVFLSIASRGWKLPGLPKIKLPSLNYFKKETIEMRKEEDSKQIDQLKQKSQEIVKTFEGETKKLSGVYAFYLVDLETGFAFGVNQKEVMTAASLIKLPVILTLYQEVEKGAFDLGTKYTIKASDRIAGSGSLYGQVGKTFTYQELANYMGQESDNTAFGIVRRKLGDEKINQTMKDLGIKTTNLVTNETTAEEIAKLFSFIWEAEVISDESKETILESLTKTIYEDFLPKAISGVRVAHKYGREVHVINDAGVVFAPKPFVLVVMTKGIVDQEAESKLLELITTIYSLWTGGNWQFS